MGGTIVALWTAECFTIKYKAYKIILFVVFLNVFYASDKLTFTLAESMDLHRISRIRSQSFYKWLIEFLI